MRFDQLKRRDFITVLGGTAVAWPLLMADHQGGMKQRVAGLQGGNAMELLAVLSPRRSLR